MSPRTLRFGFAAVGAGLGLWLAFAIVLPRLTSEAPVLLLLPVEDENFALWREHMETRYPPVPIRAFEDTTLVRLDLAKPILQKLYPPLRTPDIVWQSQLGFRRASHLSRRPTWPEHPKGSWLLATNGAGLRMDAELDPTRRTFAIAGDSHLEGACSNDESVAGLIIAALTETDPELQIVNAACGGYSFHQYLGTLEFLCGDTPGELVDPTRPITLETLAVVVYGGNDFRELLRLKHYFSHSSRPESWTRDNERLQPLRVRDPSSFGQAVTSLIYFRNAPSELSLALHEALAISEEMQRHANRRGFRLVFLYLPSALESEPEQHAERFGPILEGLEVTGQELADITRRGDTFLAGLDALGCDVIDLRPVLESDGPHFWKRDQHLNLKGQALVAEALLDWYRSDHR